MCAICMLAVKIEYHQVLTRTIANIYEWRKVIGVFAQVETLHMEE